MGSWEPPRLQTARLILTWPTETQIEGFYDAIIGTDMFDTIVWDGPGGVEDLHAWWAGNREIDPTDLVLRFSVAMIEKSSGVCVGGAGLNPKAEDPTTVTIAYTIAPMAQGKGYATETVQGLVDEAFIHRGVQRILGPVFVGNGDSRRVLEKAGFQFDGITPNALVKRGVSIDLWNLSQARESWEESLRARRG